MLICKHIQVVHVRVEIQFCSIQGPQGVVQDHNWRSLCGNILEIGQNICFSRVQGPYSYKNANCTMLCGFKEFLFVFKALTLGIGWIKFNMMHTCKYRGGGNLLLQNSKVMLNRIGVEAYTCVSSSSIMHDPLELGQGHNMVSIFLEISIKKNLLKYTAVDQELCHVDSGERCSPKFLVISMKSSLTETVFMNVIRFTLSSLEKFRRWVRSPVHKQKE